jgi:hypothetical protein
MSPHNYDRQPPQPWMASDLRWKDAGRSSVSAPIIRIAPQTVAFLDHLAAMQRVIDAARVIAEDGIPSDALVAALADLDGTGGDAA